MSQQMYVPVRVSWRLLEDVSVCSYTINTYSYLSVSFGGREVTGAASVCPYTCTYLSVSFGGREVAGDGDFAFNFDAGFPDESRGAANDERQFALLRQSDAETHDLEQSPVQRLEF